METSIENAINYCPDILLLGDFNENMLVPGQCRNIRNIMNMFNLIQLVDSPTRITQTSSTLIDLVLASDNLCCTRKGIIELFCSDHCGIHVSTNFMKINQHSFKRKIWLYYNADFDLYRESLEVCDWNLAELTVDEYVNKITSNIMQSAEVSIPNKMLTIRPRDPPWMNNTIRRAIREKNKYHRSAKRINTNDAWIRYRVSRNKVTDLVRNSKTDYFKNLASSLNQGNLSSKQWWEVTKQFLKQNKDSDIPILIQNGNHYSSSDDKANVLRWDHIVIRVDDVVRLERFGCIRVLSTHM